MNIIITNVVKGGKFERLSGGDIQGYHSIHNGKQSNWWFFLGVG